MHHASPTDDRMNPTEALLPAADERLWCVRVRFPARPDKDHVFPSVVARSAEEAKAKAEAAVAAETGEVATSEGRPTCKSEPTIGGGATVPGYTDKTAYTVIAIPKRGKDGEPLSAVLRADRAKLLNGANSGEPDALTFSRGGFVGHTSGTQRYEYRANPNGATLTVSRRVAKNGAVTWRPVGTPSAQSGQSVRFGVRDHFHDFNF